MYNVRQPLNTEAYLWGHKMQDSAYSEESQGRLNPAPLDCDGPGIASSHQLAYPLVSRIMSPGWIRLPTSSQTEILMLPVLSATLQVRTS